MVSGMLGVTAVYVNRGNVHLIGFGVAGSLGIFRLFDILHHLPDEGVAVVLVLGHDDLKDKPQSPEQEGSLTSAQRTHAGSFCRFCMETFHFWDSADTIYETWR